MAAGTFWAEAVAAMRPVAGEVVGFRPSFGMWAILWLTKCPSLRRDKSMYCRCSKNSMRQGKSCHQSRDCMLCTLHCKRHLMCTVR